MASRTSAEEKAISVELQMYKRHVLMDDNVSLIVCSWWAKYCKLFPCIEKLARRWLSVQASSGASERTFSKAGYIVQFKHQVLFPSNVDVL